MNLFPKMKKQRVQFGMPTLGSLPQPPRPQINNLHSTMNLGPKVHVPRVGRSMTPKVGMPKIGGMPSSGFKLPMPGPMRVPRPTGRQGPIMGGLSVFGKHVPRGRFNDTDKDGYPNPIDCHPHDPNRQGEAIQVKEVSANEVPKVKQGIKEKVKQYFSRDARTERLQKKIEQQKLKNELIEQRSKGQLDQLKVQKERYNVQLRRKKLVGGAAYQNPFGMSVSPSSQGNLVQNQPRPPTAADLMNPVPGFSLMGGYKQEAAPRPYKDQSIGEPKRKHDSGVQKVQIEVVQRRAKKRDDDE